MTVTTSINEAKDDLDTAMGELRRLEYLLTEHLNASDLLISDYDQAMESLSFATSKVRRVRASL